MRSKIPLAALVPGIMLIVVGVALAVHQSALVTANAALALTPTATCCNVPNDPSFTDRQGNSVIDGVGVAAITPHLAGIPSFTIADATAYVMRHGLPRGEAEGVTPTIVLAEFLTAQQAETYMYGLQVEGPPTRLVCFIKLHTPFSFANPAGKVITAPESFIYFDAQTGNELSFGGLP